MEIYAQKRTELLQRRCGFSDELLKSDAPLPVLGYSPQKFQDVLMTDQPYQLGQLCHRKWMLIFEDLIHSRFVKGANHPAGVTQQVNVQRPFKIDFGSLQGIHVQSVPRRLIDQPPCS